MAGYSKSEQVKRKTTKSSKNIRKLSKNSRPQEFKLAKSAFQLLRRIEESDKDGFVNCISCDSKSIYSKVDGGHYFAAIRSGTCFDKNNVHPQCKNCNNNMDDGRINSKYRLNLIRKIGAEEFEKLLNKSYLSIKLSSNELKNMRLDYCYQIEKIYREKFGKDLKHSLLSRADYREYKNLRK